MSAEYHARCPQCHRQVVIKAEWPLPGYTEDGRPVYYHTRCPTCGAELRWSPVDSFLVSFVPVDLYPDMDGCPDEITINVTGWKP